MQRLNTLTSNVTRTLNFNMWHFTIKASELAFCWLTYSYKTKNCGLLVFSAYFTSFNCTTYNWSLVFVSRLKLMFSTVAWRSLLFFILMTVTTILWLCLNYIFKQVYYTC